MLVAPKTPDWVLKRLFSQNLATRRSIRCDCGEQADLKGDPECAPLIIATCPTCGDRWGIIK